MDLSDLLKQFGGNVSSQAPEGVDVEESYDRLANQVPQEDLAGGLAEAFRSDETPPFANMLGGLFGNSGGSQRASVLNELLAVAGPMLMQRMASGGGPARGMQESGGGLGGLLGSIFGGGGSGGGLSGLLGQVMGNHGPTRQITAEEAEQVSPEEVEALAQEAQRHDPSIIDRVSKVYAEQPALVKTLGAGALALAISTIARSMARR